MDNSDNENTVSCTGRFYCGKWRTCDRCARARAARIADRAEYLEHRHGRLALAVATPQENTASALRALRDKLLRAKLAPAGIWTIETGELYAHLHLNLLIPAASIIHARHMVDHVELVHQTTRAAAAYICKRKGMPTETQYRGRLQGEWGNVTKHLMSTKDLAAAAAQAAAINMALYPECRPESAWIYYSSLSKQTTRTPTPPPERTRDEYAAIMRKNLKGIYAILDNGTKGSGR